jgi:hypothetical protein
MERFLRVLRARLLRFVFGPVLDPLAEIDQRLDHLGQRLDDLRTLLEAVSARASTSTESTLGVLEEAAQTARRLEEIERLLGAR